MTTIVLGVLVVILLAVIVVLFLSILVAVLAISSCYYWERYHEITTTNDLRTFIITSVKAQDARRCLWRFKEKYRRLEEKGA